MNGVSSIRDVLAIESRPRSQALPTSTYEMLRRGAVVRPHAPALSFFLRSQDHARPSVWSYSAFMKGVNQAANLFTSLGVTYPDVIAFVLPNLPETHFTMWGGQMAGVVAPINPLLEPSAIAELLAATEARVLVTLAPFPGTDLWQKLCPVLKGVPTLRHVVLVNLAGHVQGTRGLAARALQKREEFRAHGLSGLRGTMLGGVRVHDFGSAAGGMPGERLATSRKVFPGDYSSFFCTGGTTGRPKIAMRTHANEIANASSVTEFVGDLGPGKTVFSGLPLFHVNGALVTGLLPFSRGAHVVLGTPMGFRGEGVISRFWEMVERHRINFFSGVPTLYAALLNIPIDGRDVSSLEYGLCGAAPMPVEVFRGFEEKTGIRILEGYGLTEATCVCAINPPRGERRVGSVGLRIPAQAMKTVILDELGSHVRDAGADEIGVVVVSGPNVFAGYKAAEHNKGLWMDLGDGNKWLNTGDLGRQDQEGYLWLTGRKKELIIRGGHNIDPVAIEEPLHRHPAVQLAAAVGRPDAHAGEIPVVYVQLKEGTSPTEQELEAFAKREIQERVAHPKHVRIVEKMPLTAVGKIFKPQLRTLEIQDALAVALREAHIAVQDLKVSDEGARGLVIQVKVRSACDKHGAARALGRFPFAFSVQTPEAGSQSLA